MQRVSIPYSSGHLFRCKGQVFITSEQARMSQSLIHQVIYSVNCEAWNPGLPRIVSIPYSSGHLFRSEQVDLLNDRFDLSLNPLFIRSSIPLGEDVEWETTFSLRGLNPLFIRSSIPLRRH